MRSSFACRKDTLYPPRTKGSQSVVESPHIGRFPHPMDIRARVHNASIQDARLWLPQNRLSRPTGIRSHVRIAGTPGDLLLQQRNRRTVHPTNGSHARVHT
jgi:hypothetical protein